MTTISVLTLNLWGTNGPVGRRLPALAEALSADRPDVLCLQEVERWRGRTQAAWLAERLAYRFSHDTRTGRGARRGEGLAVLSDLPSEQLETVRLPDGWADHPRGLQVVDVLLDRERVVRVGNTHLAWRLRATAARVRQANAIVEAFRAWKHPQLLLCGDLNDTPVSPTLRTLAGAPTHLVDAFAATGMPERPTFDEANPHLWQPQLAGRRVDHVLARGFEPLAARLAFDGTDEPVVSDHYGVRVALRAAV